jgi:hypothetical protein
VITAILLAAFAMPAFAEDMTIKQDDSSKAGTIDQTTTASTAKKQSDMAPTVIKENMYGGCMHRNNTAQNMM